MVKLSVFNRKGGIGKTTVAMNVASYMNKKGYKVLLIDCDDQTDLSRTLHKQEFSEGIKEVLEGRMNIDEILWWYGNEEYLYTLGSSDLHTYESKGKDFRFNDILKAEILDDVDFVIFDTPPSISDCSMQALMATDYVLIVTDMDEFSLANVSLTIDDIEAIKSKWNPDIELLGIVANKHHKGRGVCKKNLSELRKYPNNLAFNNYIGNYTAIPYSQANAALITDVKWSKVSRQFSLLTDEVISRVSEREGWDNE